MLDAWITTRASLPDVDSLISFSAAAPDTPITVGRRAAVSLGIDVPDEGISRVALTITATTSGWVIINTSRNGIVVSPWALAPQRPSATLQLRWPLLAVRVLGTRRKARHEVLLECDAYDAVNPDVLSARGPTAAAASPRPLTPAETAALNVVFESHLAWPPRDYPAEPLQLKQAARRLGVTASAVKVRLEGARTKAEMLGLEGQSGVTDPAYLHVLAAAGYLTPPTDRCHQRQTAGEIASPPD